MHPRSLLLCLLLSILQGTAATIVPPGSLLGTQIWTAADSPYLISGDVVVGASGRICMGAGTEVQFSATDSSASGVDPARCEFRVLSGLLVVNGSSTNPVIFRAISNAAPSTWRGISVTNGLGAFITNAWIQDAYTGVQSDNTNLTVLEGVTLCSNRLAIGIGSGLSSTNCPAFLNRLRVFQNTNGMILNSLAQPRVRNSAFSSNFSRGAIAVGSYFVNCTFDGNGVAIELAGQTVHVLNCMFISNSIGLFRAMNEGGTQPHPVTVDAQNCLYWGNTANTFDANGFGISTGSNPVFADPLYANRPGNDGLRGTADDDFRLHAGSPAIDHGDNNFVVNGPFFDLDGNARMVDDPATADGPGQFTLPPLVDIGATEFQPLLRILSIKQTNGTVVFAFPTIPGTSYQPQYTHTLTGWTNLPVAPFLGNGLVRTQLDTTASAPHRFYQVEKFP